MTYQTSGRLAPGQSLALEIDADDLRMGRMDVQPVWRGIGKFPPGPCRASVELIDNMTGRTTVAVPATLLADAR